MTRTKTVLTIVALTLLLPGAALAGDKYKIDPVHSTALFKALHFGAGYTYGMFRKVGGELTVDEKNPAKSSVSIELETASIYTADQKRDKHLQAADFLNAKQYPKITFESTKVAKTSGGANVTGKLSLHGVTKTVTVKMLKVGSGKDPWGNTRIGFEGTFKVKLSDYKIKGVKGAVGDQVQLTVAVEGMKK